MSETKGDANDWYERIEEPIRPVVRLLRDNGFETFNSCASQMTVASEYIPEGEVLRLHRLLNDSGFKNYTIAVQADVRDGKPDCMIHVTIRRPWKPAYRKLEG